MTTNGNGTIHHNGAVVDKLVAAGLVQDVDRGNHAAVGRALDNLLNKFAAVPPGRPNTSFFISPQIEGGACTHLMLGLMEVLIALDVVPPQAMAAVFVHARSTAQAAYLPLGVQELLGHYAEVLD